MVKQASRMVPLIGGEPSLLNRGVEFDVDKWQTLRTSALELARHLTSWGRSSARSPYR